MISPAGCVEEALKISRFCATVENPQLRLAYLQIAQAWLDLSCIGHIEDDLHAALLGVARCVLLEEPQIDA